MFFPISPRPPNGMICNLAFAKMDRTSYSVVGAGSRRLLKKIFLHDMSKIKAVHSRFSYYITWGKEIGECGGGKMRNEELGVASDW